MKIEARRRAAEELPAPPWSAEFVQSRGGYVSSVAVGPVMASDDLPLLDLEEPTVTEQALVNFIAVAMEHWQPLLAVAQAAKAMVARPNAAELSQLRERLQALEVIQVRLTMIIELDEETDIWE